MKDATHKVNDANEGGDHTIAVTLDAAAKVDLKRLKETASVTTKQKVLSVKGCRIRIFGEAQEDGTFVERAGMTMKLKLKEGITAKGLGTITGTVEQVEKEIDKKKVLVSTITVTGFEPAKK